MKPSGCFSTKPVLSPIPDMLTVIIPNRKIIGEILHNCGRSRQRSIWWRSASPRHSLNTALAAVDGVLRHEFPRLESPAAVVARLGI